MEIPQLTDKAYAELKEKLHHAHDKFWKMLFMLSPVIREYLEKVILPQLPNVSFDLDNLILDNTSYVTPRLQPFYSDLVYLTTMTDAKGTKKPVKVALLLEHKSAMPSQLQLRLQLLEYIVAIQHRNYDETQDTTMVVIPNVFNQFDKNWQMDSFRSLFKDLSPEMTEFIPEYKILMTNLPEFPTEMMDAFEKYGELRAGMLAMKHAKNKKFLFQHFEELFVFLERHPNREALRSQMVVYLLSASALDAQDLERLLKNIFSPILQKEVQMYGTGFIASAYREGELKAQKEAEKAQLVAIQLEKRTTMMRLWKKKFTVELIADVVQLPVEAVEKLITAFDKAKTYFESKERVSTKKMMTISGLAEAETVIFLKILKEK